MDYYTAYEVLKLQTDASTGDIKKSYRALSLLWHPDRNNNSVTSNEEFLKIKEAYKYLLQIKGSRNELQERSIPAVKQLPPNEFNLSLTLEELFSGCTKSQTISRKITDENNVERVEEKTLSVQVKPGLLGGYRLIVEKEGDIYQKSVPANVIFIITEQPHPYFTRSRFDLKYTATITTTEALLGCELQIPTIESEHEFIRLVINAGENVNNKTVKVFPGRGMPHPNEPTQRGDLIVNFEFNDPLPDVFKDIPVTLNEVINGCIKNVKIQWKKYEPDGSEIAKEKFLAVDIKRGIEEGTKICFAKEGNQRGSQRSDVIFTIHNEPNDVFTRSGLDLIYTASITKRESHEGCQLKIPTPDSRTVKLNIDGEVNLEGYRIVKKGLPSVDDADQRGDLVVQFKIVKQAPPIVKDILLSLEEVFAGCTKLVTHTRRIVEDDDYEMFDKKKFTLEFKPGVTDGTKLVFPQEGDKDPESLAADLIFVARDKPSDVFKRKGANLLYIYQMSKFQAENGGKFKVPTLDGKRKTFQLEGPIPENCVKTLKNFGLPFASNPSQFGDIHVKFELLPEAKPKDSDIEQPLPLTLDNVIKGCTKKLKINRLYLQSDGAECEEDKIITVTVPPGTLEGTPFRFENCGDEKPGIVPADLVFIARDKPHAHFKRNAANIEYTALVTQSEAQSGFELEIPTIDGDDPILLTIKNSLDPRVSKNFPKRGLPLVDDPKKRGDLIVKFFVVPDEQKDSDTVMPLPVSLETVLYGKTKQMKISRKVEHPDGKEEIVSKMVTINIKPGTEAGTRFTFLRHGDMRSGYIPGAVIFVLEYKPYAIFRRSGVNLNYIAKIAQSELRTGGEVDVPTLEREIVTVSFEKPSNGSPLKVLKGKGLPLPKDSSKRGDIIVEYEVIEPGDEPNQVDPIRIDLELTLEEIYAGCFKKVLVNRICKFCFQDDVEYIDVKIFPIKIPPGIESGKQIIIAKAGNRCLGKTPGDLIINIKEKPHKDFVRRGVNLEHTIEITKSQSAFGFSRDIPLLGRTPFTVMKISRYYNSNRKVFEGHGLPYPDDPTKFGDMIVNFKIIDPAANHQLEVPPVELKLHLSLEDVLKGYSKDFVFHKRIHMPGGRMHKCEDILKIRTRPGIESGERIEFKGRGHQHPGARTGDVVFTVLDRPHRYFWRNGADILFTSVINRNEANHGFEREIPTLEGDTVTLSVKEPVRRNTTKTIEGRGLPMANDAEKRGNLIVWFKILKASS